MTWVVLSLLILSCAPGIEEQGSSGLHLVEFLTWKTKMLFNLCCIHAIPLLFSSNISQVLYAPQDTLGTIGMRWSIIV